MSRFSITNHKGVNITFENGWQVSVQWGPGNYCDYHNSNDYELPQKKDFWSSNTAEIAVWSRKGPHNGELIELEHEVVRGYTTADEVAKVITIVSRAKSTLTNKQMSNKLKKIWQ